MGGGCTDPGNRVWWKRHLTTFPPPSPECPFLGKGVCPSMPSMPSTQILFLHRTRDLGQRRLLWLLSCLLSHRMWSRGLSFRFRWPQGQSKALRTPNATTYITKHRGFLFRNTIRGNQVLQAWRIKWHSWKQAWLSYLTHLYTLIKAVI